MPACTASLMFWTVCSSRCLAVTRFFHSVAWQTAHQGEDRHGEIDLVVLAPSGNILLSRSRRASSR